MIRVRLHSAAAGVSLALMLLILQAAVASAGAQEKEQTFGDSYIPLVYPQRNTGAFFRTPDFPSFAQLPIVRPLPDPFRLGGEWRDTSFASWERHRAAIMAAIEKYEIGPVPDCSDCTITANYVPPATAAGSGTLTVNITRKGKTITLTSGVYIPQGMGSGPFPALIPMEIASGVFTTGGGFSFPPPTPPDYGSLPPSVLQNLPIATVGYVSTQVAEYCFNFSGGTCAHATDGFYQLYPELCGGTCPGTSNSGIYAAWSWGLSRLIDGMEIASRQTANPLPVDMSHLGVTGCSFAGKMALFSGAFDERVALTIAQENGGGGAPSWRVSHDIEPQQSVEDVDDTDYNWFAGQMLQFAGDNVYKLPVDHDELEAMVAPRALLETGNTDFYWLSNRSNYVSARATQRIYNTLGIGDRFGFYIDGGHAHCATLPAESPAIAAFIDKFMLGQSNVSSDVEVDPYPSLDYRRWTAWWGRGPSDYPRFPDDWNTGGTVVMSLSSMPAWQGLFDLPGFTPIDTGDTVEAGYQLQIPGGTHPAATASLANGRITADVRCFDGSSYSLTIPLPANQSYTIPAGNSQWVPGQGTWQASATAPGCADGDSRGVLEGAYFSALSVATSIGSPPTGTGFTTSDTADPLVTRFSLSADGRRTRPSRPLAVNFGQ
ncbi:MAG: glucuronyl esterase domain-containing protein [Steroidobacteraceae bacterium]